MSCAPAAKQARSQERRMTWVLSRWGLPALKHLSAENHGSSVCSSLQAGEEIHGPGDKFDEDEGKQLTHDLLAREVRGEQQMLSEDSQAPSPQHVFTTCVVLIKIFFPFDSSTSGTKKEKEKSQFFNFSRNLCWRWFILTLLHMQGHLGRNFCTGEREVDTTMTVPGMSARRCKSLKPGHKLYRA